MLHYFKLREFEQFLSKGKKGSSVTEKIVVRPGPQEYICQAGILDTLPDQLKERKTQRVVILHGSISWNKAREYLETLFDSSVAVQLVSFGGECTYDEVSRVQTIAETFRADSIIGIGGGKIMDTAKYVAYRILNCSSVLIPTLASNCAPWTSLSVMYTADGEYIGYDFLTQQASLLLIEPQLILDSPVAYFVAGIGDTLAKWYESDALLSLPENQTAPLLMARAAAHSCKNVIENYAIQAVADAKKQILSDEYIKLMETIILTSGLVGGFGDALARTTGAHGIHDGLTIYPEVHRLLHGEKVAYGVLVQLALDHKFDELPEVLALFQSLQLPTSLMDLGLVPTDQLYLELAQSAIDHFPMILNLPYPITPEILAQAIKDIEKFVNKQK